MKIATLLFTYNRSAHTEQVVTSLKNNTVLPKKLIIFQDGLREESESSLREWQKVNALINQIDWCDKEVIVSKYNKGLAESIVSGINYAFMENDAVIVLEDDCVVAPNFIRFMEQCFEQYERKENIYSVSGYSWPIDVKKDQYDVYGCGRFSSWGWGTWKDRWENYNIDNDIIKRLKQDRIKSQNLVMWGNDCERMLIDRIVGNNDSWAVYWALKIIECEGICINPYNSLIQNIGLDGTGVHCGKTDHFQVMLSDDLKQTFKLPDIVSISNNVKEAFAGLHGSYTSINIKSGEKEKILVYGLGNFFAQYEKAINEKYYIEAFVDQSKYGWFAGKKIIKRDEIGEYKYDKIIIMIQNIQECINIARALISQGINADKIFLGHNLYGHYSKAVENLSVLPDGNLSVTVDGITIAVRSLDEFNNAYEVLVDKIYDYYLNNNKKDIVLDVGMNIGDASLYALKNERVEKVYAYEPFKETFFVAKDNLQKYLYNTDRIEIFQYGISDENAERKVNFNYNMTCGQSTMADIREKAYVWYKKVGLVQMEDEKEEHIEVRDAVEVFLPIIQRHSKCNIILKMDCEGEEYAIIEKLLNEGILPLFSFIMLEWHYKGKDNILSWLRSAGFSYWCNDKRDDMGLIYAINIRS